jgi:hypothetical protein
VIAPGLAHAETITTFHSARFMADPNAINCNFSGNPLHEEQLEIVRMLGGALALNTVVDEARNLSFVNFGEIVASHLVAVSFVRDYAEVPVKRRFKTVVTSAAGYPLDKTYYQTVRHGRADRHPRPGRPFDYCLRVFRGPWFSGICRSPAPSYSAWIRQFLRRILLKSHAEIDEWQTQMQLKPMAIGTLQLYSTGLSLADRALTGVTCVESVHSAVLDSVEASGDPAVAFIPEGPYVVPFYESS